MLRVLSSVLFASFVFIPSISFAAEACKGTPLEGSDQVLLSLVGGWDSTDALVMGFERAPDSKNWTRSEDFKGASSDLGMPAVIGKNGLGWSAGVQPPQFDLKQVDAQVLAENFIAHDGHLSGCPDHIKRESDGCAPAGVFDLGQAFGYDNPQTEGVAPGGISYTQVSQYSRCVDAYNIETDPATQAKTVVPSKYYDHDVFDYRALGQDRDFDTDVDCKGNGVEVLDRRILTCNGQNHGDDLYHYAITVKNYSGASATPGAGSCIFIHIHRAPDPLTGIISGTAGCTALSEPDIQSVFKWGRAAANPRLVQLTMAEYDKHRIDWCLPPIDESAWMDYLLKMDCRRNPSQPKCSGQLPAMGAPDSCGQNR